MNTDTLIQNLSETQILSEVRRVFEGESLQGINVEQLINDSATLADLYNRIRTELDQRLPTH